MEIAKYSIMKQLSNQEFTSLEFWNNVEKITLDNYLWMNNDYQPKVTAKVSYSDEYLFVCFRSDESEITARFTEINDYVHKDSCVEFFINLFPYEKNEYVNFEINAIGTIYVGFGEVGNRLKLTIEEINNIEIFSTIDKPIIGKHGSESWEVYYKIPFSLFENRYNMKFKGEPAKANFYKCGDESKFEHYGSWTNIESDNPNFHLPEFFGTLNFQS